MLASYFFVFSATLFGIAGTILAIFNYNPYEATTSTFAYFYISLLISLSGILTFLIYFAKLKFLGNEGINKYFWPSVRQAVIISIGAVLLLLLDGLRLLDWWVGVPTVIAVVLLEMFFQTNRKHAKSSK